MAAKTETDQNLRDWVLAWQTEKLGRWLIKLTEESKDLNVEVEALNLNKSAVSGVLTKIRENQKIDSLLGKVSKNDRILRVSENIYKDMDKGSLSYINQSQKYKWP